MEIGRGHRGIHTDDAIESGDFQRAFNHATRSSQPQISLRLLKATHDASDSRAFDMRNAREVKNYPRLAFLNESGNRLFDPYAARASMDATLHLQHSNTALQLPLRDSHGSDVSNHFPYSNVSARLATHTK